MRALPYAFLALLLAGCATGGPPLRNGRLPDGPQGDRPAGIVPGRLFISPLGEPFRSDRAGDPEAAWFGGADADHDGRLTLAEFQADARRWFALLDRRHAGEIDPDDIEHYENELVPEIRVADELRARTGGGDRPHAGRRRGGSSGGGGGPAGGFEGAGGGGGQGGGFGGGRVRGGGSSGSGQPGEQRVPVTTAARRGAARYSYLDIPEPITAADRNLNRGIDADEMDRAAAERFALLDRNGDGVLERRELPRVDTRTSGRVPRPGGSRRPPAGPPPGVQREEDE